MRLWAAMAMDEVLVMNDIWGGGGGVRWLFGARCGEHAWGTVRRVGLLGLFRSPCS